MRTNLKTHKPHGQVKPRAMHSATRNPLVPLGMCVAWEHGWVLSFEWHILNSVEEFHDQSRNWCLDQLTGSSLDMSKIRCAPSSLRKITAHTLYGKERHLVERILVFLLRNRFLKKAQCGYGMCEDGTRYLTGGSLQGVL